MQRFKNYIDDTLNVAAEKAEKAVSDAADTLPVLTHLGADGFSERVEQIRQSDPKLADALSSFQASATQRRKEAAKRLAGDESASVSALVSPHAELKELAQNLGDEKDKRVKASEAEERERLASEMAGLEDRKILAANRKKLVTRRDLLKTDAAFEKALAELQTMGITRRANELVDSHLTNAVVNRFDVERERFDIIHHAP